MPSKIPTGLQLFDPVRRNSRGYDLGEPGVPEALAAAIAGARDIGRIAAPIVGGTAAAGTADAVRNPATGAVVGHVIEADADMVDAAVAAARAAQGDWSLAGGAFRAERLERAADLLEERDALFLGLAIDEAGKTLVDAVAEVREAVDFLRYYAAQARADFTYPIALPGPTGERNELILEGKGVFVAISPWNFPLAIFTGQIAAALVTGNAVVAKPAEQTPLIAARAVELLHQAGIPQDVLQLLPGDGPSVGAPLTADPRIAGVCFTGSTEVARLIERQLAETAAPDAMLIAETGGLNAMIVDSTALPEQAVRDILASAFQSAGQRCSALRILYVQQDVEKKVLEMLTGAMEELNVGDPWQIATDVGPVIDDDARKSIQAYCAEMERAGRLIARLDAPSDGRFVAPHIFRVHGIEDMQREVFGPVLHVATFKADEIDKVISGVNIKGYGLTFGLHTRIEGRVQHFVDGVHAGNIYVNRNQIGAVVGSQPFGGEGLSGTGPKAGGPHYLRRFRKAEARAALAPSSTEPATLEALQDHLKIPARESWAARPDRIGILRKHLRGKASAAIAAAASIDFGAVDLPGPTGEANTLMLHPRGVALCLGPDAETLLAQAVQALASGCAVLAVAPNASVALNALTGKALPIAVLDGSFDAAHAGKIAIDVVAFAGDESTMRSLRKELASRKGPIVPLVGEVIYPTAYAHERAVCVDTTAAGGNASLLAAA